MPMWLSIISIICTIVFGASTFYFANKSNKRTDTKEIEERVKSDTIVNVKLDDIIGNVKDIKTDVSTMRQDILNMDKRLVIVEQSTKSAHHRLDSMEGHFRDVD